MSSGKLNPGKVKIIEAKHLAQRLLELIKSGVIGYALFKANKLGG